MTGYYPDRGLFNQGKSGPIVDRLRKELAILPGDRFMGSVATVWGAKGGALRQELSLPASTTLEPGQFEEFIAYVGNKTGNDHDLIDLWRFNIPTLSEYGQSVSRQYMFYIQNFLSESGDPTEVSIAFPRKANVGVMAAMGVCFIVIDRPLSDSRVTLALTEQFAHTTLYLYEIADPILGNYSPVSFELDPNLSKFRASVEGDPGVLARTAYVQELVEGTVVPARDAQMAYEKGGVHVTASNEGTSVLLLPLQFSHCLSTRDHGVKLSRANLIFTQIKFHGVLDTKIEWEFDFWRGSDCRVQDVGDMRLLGLLN